MLLATYQSKNLEIRHTKDRGTSYTTALTNLESLIGFDPIFCFSAEDMVTFTVESILSDPGQPERLYLFEADQVVKISASRWTEYFNNPAGRDIESILDPKEDSDIEYLIPSIPEDYLYFDMDHYSDFDIYWSEDVLDFEKREVERYLKKLKEDAKDLVKQGCTIKEAVERSGLLSAIYRMKVNTDEEDGFFFYQESLAKKEKKLKETTKVYKIRDERRELYHELKRCFAYE